MGLVAVIFLNIKTTLFRLWEWVRTVIFYYSRSLKFAWIDLLILCEYFFKNPHRISRDFLRAKGEKNPYAFGETPLTTLHKIAKECAIQSKDIFYELGCGSGRTCFWLSCFVRCRVVGVDYLPLFISKAERIKKRAHCSDVTFLQKDMLEVDFKNANVIYLYGTCLEDDMIENLVQSFKRVRPKTKIITVSYPLSDYGEGFFSTVKVFAARFPWGKADVFLNERNWREEG